MLRTLSQIIYYSSIFLTTMTLLEDFVSYNFNFYQPPLTTILPCRTIQIIFRIFYNTRPHRIFMCVV